MDFKKIKSFVCSSNSVEKTINGNNLKFYPLKVSILAEIREFAESIAQAITLYNGEGIHDIETIIKKDEHVSKAIDPQLASIRMNEKLSATTKIVHLISDEGTRVLSAKAILNSLRASEIPKSSKELSDFIEDMDFNTLALFVSGVIEVHKEAFSPLIQSLRSLVPREES